MKKVLAAILVLLSAPALLNAQEVDYGAIRDTVAQDGVYDSLVVKFSRCILDFGKPEFNFEDPDWTLLYYGFAFRDSYLGSMDAMNCPAKKRFGEEEYQAGWDEGIEHLRENPVSLTTLKYIVQCGKACGKSEEERLPYMARLTTLLGVIHRSGDGKSPETAFGVLSVADEYMLMDLILSVTGIKSQALSYGDSEPESHPHDVFVIKGARRYEGSEVWFDVSLPMERLKVLFGNTGTGEVDGKHNKKD